MKKIISFVGAVLLASTSIGQAVTFDTLNLNPESYDNGSLGNGDFVFDELTFTNYYDTAWMSWNGFAISNVTDTVTAGWGNQYAAYTGSGYAGSENFAVHYPQGTIGVSGGGTITGFWITNTSYAAIAMRDGDAFSKQFGSPLNASGVPDGTNGEDYFRVWIIGEDLTGTNKDSVEFYLADYRFANNAQDYIVDTWEHIDLSTFTFDVSIVSFRFESSDVGQWGINTPTYFALDNIEYSMPLGVSEQSIESIRLYPNPASDELFVQGGSGVLTVKALNGQTVIELNHSEYTALDVSFLNAGMYFVQLDNGSQSWSRKLIVK